MLQPFGIELLVKWMLPGQHLEQDDPQAPDIHRRLRSDLLVRFESPEMFGRHPRSTATKILWARVQSCLGQSQVGNSRHPIAAVKNIRRLQVEVNNIIVVYVADAHGDLWKLLSNIIDVPALIKLL